MKNIVEVIQAHDSELWIEELLPSEWNLFSSTKESVIINKINRDKSTVKNVSMIFALPSQLNEEIEEQNWRLLRTHV